MICLLWFPLLSVYKKCFSIKIHQNHNVLRTLQIQAYKPNSDQKPINKCKCWNSSTILYWCILLPGLLLPCDVGKSLISDCKRHSTSVDVLQLHLPSHNALSLTFVVNSTWSHYHYQKLCGPHSDSFKKRYFNKNMSLYWAETNISLFIYSN